jgi:alpha-N-arabinofuranosidase
MIGTMQDARFRRGSRSLPLPLVLLLLVARTSDGRAEDPLEASIAIDPSRPSAPISRRLFGKFTEHLGRNVYQGMWAQVLQNPGFERWTFFGSRREKREQSEPSGVAALWSPLGTAGRFRLEDDCAVPGQSAQSIAAEAADSSSPVGVRQEIRLPLHRESDYRLSFRSKGQDLSAGFAMSVRRGGETLAWAAFPPPTKDWEAREARLTIPRGGENPAAGLQFAVELLSAGSLTLDLLELFPEDCLEGFDRDVVRLCREARLPLLRYPGGNFSSGYHFRDGIGPRELRPMRRNPAWDMAEPNHVGTDEFLAFCRLAGCEPLICVNAGNGSAEEAAAWVEYLNGPATSALGRLRARNGHPEPYGVRLFEIGNELYGSWQIGHTSAAEYAERYLRFKEAMSAVDPSLVFIANGFDAAWNRTLLERCGAEVRSFSVHPLIGGGTPADADPERTFRALMAYPTAFEKDLREQLEWARGRGLSPRVAVTELQIFTNRPSLPSNSTLSEALFLGRFIHAAIRLGGEVEMITHSALVNHGGGLSKQQEAVFAQPVHQAHVLYGTMTGVRPVPVKVECGKFSAHEPHIPPAEGAPDLDAVALLDGTGEELTLVAINTHPRSAIRAKVACGGAKAARARRIDGPSYLTRNSLEERTAVALRTIDLSADSLRAVPPQPPGAPAGPAAGEEAFLFPAHSITEIVFTLR